MTKCILVFSLFPLFVSVIAGAQETNFKFDFGTERNTPGYINIVPESKFSEGLGYGFSYGTNLTAIARGGDALQGDYITSSSPFYFSVRLTEGNYDVKLILGDTKGNSATTVRVEYRRLMLENIRTSKGKVIEPKFT